MAEHGRGLGFGALPAAFPLAEALGQQTGLQCEYLTTASTPPPGGARAALRQPRCSIGASAVAADSVDAVFDAGQAARPFTYTAHAHRNVRAAASFLAWLHSRSRVGVGEPPEIRVGRGPRQER